MPNAKYVTISEDWGCLNKIRVVVWVAWELLLFWFFSVQCFFGGGVLLRVGGLGISLGRDSLDRQPVNSTNLTDLETRKKIAEESSQKLRTQIEQGHCQDAYAQGSETFKKNLSYAEMISICEAIKQNVGSLSSVQLTDWWDEPADVESNGYILLRYTTTFSKATVRETFVWQVKDSKAELFSYEIYPLSAPNNNKKTQLI